MKTQHCKRNHKTCKTLDFCAVEIDKLVPEWTRLFKSLKPDIADDYRCSDEPDDNTPGMQVTIGFTPSDPARERGCQWQYQTGDNSFSGGAYGHSYWAVICLYRRANCRELAKECAEQIAESVSQL